MQNLILVISFLVSCQKIIDVATLPVESEAKCKSECTTSVCLSEADFFKKYMNFSTDPCDDFYQFVCGNYLKTVSIPGDKPGITHFDTIEDEIRDNIINGLKADVKSSSTEAFKKLKTHYHNCLDEDTIERLGVTPILEFLDKLGGWPVLLGDKWEENNYNWQESVSNISKHGFDPKFPIGLSIAYDPTNTSIYVLNVDSAETIVDESFYVNGSESLEAYNTLLIETAVLLGAPRDEATLQMEECADFEVELYKIQLPPPELRALSPVDNRKSIKDLSTENPDISWLELFNRILNPSNVSVAENEIVIVADPQFVSKIGQLIKNTPKRVLANYQIWKVIYKLIDYLPKSFRRNLFDYDKAVIGLQQEPDREIKCFDLLKSTLEIAVSSMFIKNYFNKQSKDGAEDVLHNIKEELRNTLEKTSWMDDNTRKNALAKLDAMRSLVGYPDQLTNDLTVENYYKDLQIDSGNFFKDFCKISNHTKNFAHNMLRKPMNEVEWTFETMIALANAFYSPDQNKIHIVAGILQKPFFEFDRPDYMNYGGIGYVIGHEITHGFDSNGRKYDKDGSYKNWWNNKTASEFEAKVKCLIDQYSNYVVKQIGQKMDGDRTKGENIADAGGIKLAYHAYQNSINRKGKSEQCLSGLDYSPQQMFWISAATTWCGKYTDELMRLAITDWHSPLEARVNVAFSNINEFAADFNCPAGSKMNPTDNEKCIVW